MQIAFLMAKSRRAAALFLLVLLLPAGALDAAHPEAARGSGGAVASAAPAATEAGLEVLRAGGNAADAAVATALALAVVRPRAGNLGGGGFAVTRFGSEVKTLDFRETAPAEATHDMYLDERGEPRPGGIVDRATGRGRAGISGRAVRAPQKARSAALGESGCTGDQARAGRFHGRPPARASGPENTPISLRRFPETAAVWLPGGKPPEAGSYDAVARAGGDARSLRRERRTGDHRGTDRRGGRARGAPPRWRSSRRRSGRLSPGVARTGAIRSFRMAGGVDAIAVFGRNHPRSDLRYAGASRVVQIFPLWCRSIPPIGRGIPSRLCRPRSSRRSPDKPGERASTACP